MEDCNTLISDCIIISCCCQCLLLQLVVFMLLQLPLRVARKTKEYAKRKLWNTRKKKKKKKKKQDDEQKVEEYDELIGYNNYNSDDKSGKSMSLRLLELEGMAVNDLHKWGTCMEEVDKVFQDLSFKGQFGFGSFWGTTFVNNHQINHTLNNNNNDNNKCYCKCNRRLTKEDELDFGSHVVKFHLIEIIGRFS